MPPIRKPMMTASANISRGRPPISAIWTSELLRQARHAFESTGAAGSGATSLQTWQTAKHRELRKSRITHEVA
jgi:hypothetical protein